MKKVILLVDADSMVYASCCVSKEESKDGYQHDIEEAKLKLDNIFHYMYSAIEDMGIDAEYMMFVAGGGNVRKALSDHYKSSRKPKPPLLEDVTQYVLDNYVSFSCINVEVDDVVACTFWKYKDKYDLIVCSSDKDLLQLPTAYYDTYWNREDDKRMFSISENQAQINFWRLVLMGDAGDDVKGIKGIGKKKAEAILPDSLSSSFAGGRVYRQYLNAYGLSRGAREFWRAYHLIKLPERGITIPDLTLFV